MSLGFLTESALLPSKAKAIKVDSKSLVDLRAVVFQKEQERQERNRAVLDAATTTTAAATTTSSLLDASDDVGVNNTTIGARGFGRFAHLRAAKKRGSSAAALSRDEERIGKASNRGVEKRRRQDEAAHELELDEHAGDRAWHRKSRDILAKKAKLYDAMLLGAGGTAECLVDFSAKQQRACKDSAVGAASSVARDGGSASVEITDEFGRSRVVAAHSAAHAAYLEQQAAADARTVSLSSSSAASASSALCRSPLAHGNDADPDARDIIVATTNNSTTTSSGTGSFVVSQWEKRLNAQEKTFLQEVHAGVSVAKSVVRLDKAARKQQRLEKLRQQQLTSAAASAVHGAASSASLTVTAAGATSALSVRDDQAAAQQATAFLNQFGALM